MMNHSTGTENGGNDFPGVVRPWGMVKLGPDNLDPGLNTYSGYAPRGAFSGFSLMHMSGTGGAPKYGTVSQLPVIGSISNPLSNLTVERAVTDTASVGYYRAETVYGIVIEMAATWHAGFYQYTFPKDVQCNVIIDVSHILTSYRGNGLEQGYVGGNLTLHPDGHYEGSGIYNNGWNRAPDWTIYFCILRYPVYNFAMADSKQMVILILNPPRLRCSLPLV
jgi:putative alpha-1,2-mannosidase